VNRQRRPRPAQDLAGLAGRVPPAVLGASASVVIAAVVVLGALQRYAYPHWRFANLDSESSMGLWFAAGLLWMAAGLWFLVVWAGRSGTRWTVVWAAALAWLALDEGNAVHERLEKWSGIDWQILYLPVIGVAALAWWAVTGSHRRERPITAAMAAGAAAWAAALLLELLQNWGGEPPL
jgi:hypothetical protein